MESVQRDYQDPSQQHEHLRQFDATYWTTRRSIIRIIHVRQVTDERCNEKKATIDLFV